MSALGCYQSKQAHPAADVQRGQLHLISAHPDIWASCDIWQGRGPIDMWDCPSGVLCTTSPDLVADVQHGQLDAVSSRLHKGCVKREGEGCPTVQALPQIAVPKPDSEGDVAANSHANVEGNQALLQKQACQTCGNMLYEECRANTGMLHDSSAKVEGQQAIGNLFVMQAMPAAKASTSRRAHLRPSLPARLATHSTAWAPVLAPQNPPVHLAALPRRCVHADRQP